jgi:hypothetical protein
MELPQEKLIASTRRVCQEDARLLAAMLYGSFTRREADRYSDIDCMLFFEDEFLAAVDPRVWIEQIAPVELQRGEMARSLEILKIVQDDLLRMARMLEGTAQTWITPTKALEEELTVDSYRSFQRCTARLDRDEISTAYQYSWEWGIQMLAALAGDYGFKLNRGLIDKISLHFKFSQ